MTAPEKRLTLNDVKKTAKVKAFRASDFLTDEEQLEVRKSNAKGKRRAGFDAIDAFIAEVIARFGYEAYVAWKEGEISEEQLIRYVLAERARDAAGRLPTENIIVAAMAGANNTAKGGHAPKSLKAAIKMLKQETKMAKGGK